MSRHRRLFVLPLIALVVGAASCATPRPFNVMDAFELTLTSVTAEHLATWIHRDLATFVPPTADSASEAIALQAAADELGDRAVALAGALHDAEAVDYSGVDAAPLRQESGDLERSTDALRERWTAFNRRWRAPDQPGGA